MNKYLHLKVERDKDIGEIISETMIFPRYHQLDMVTKLLADVKINGSGKDYLIQHSAGSGKSNSIAWLAHRLAGLHNTYDEKIGGVPIIITTLQKFPVIYKEVKSGSRRFAVIVDEAHSSQTGDAAKKNVHWQIQRRF